MVTFVEAVLTDWFFWFWVLLVLTIIFVPLGLVGAKTLYGWYDKKFGKPRKGYLRARQKMPNDQLREFWLKPTGKMAKIKNIEGMEIQTPITTGKGFVAFEGATPYIELDEQGHQIQFGKSLTTGTVSQEDTAKGWQSAYQTGKLMGAVDWMNELKLLIYIMLGITVIFGLFNGYMLYTMKPPTLDTNIIARSVALELLNITNRGPQFTTTTISGEIPVITQ